MTIAFKLLGSANYVSKNNALQLLIKIKEFDHVCDLENSEQKLDAS
ncbi:hypothetical protein H1P_3360010 [Hyella patelloides LEGE 07179]|uniref:Uncharacterized protein n=1 Tax=Hyella patelloides LEGE 07179 TaxID=945734 RepID=A0A563VW25_9CYAN|nr:hypothetical protein H1P_3360010 [Hyella patelloides LEGE 07179]